MGRCVRGKSAAPACRGGVTQRRARICPRGATACCLQKMFRAKRLNFSSAPYICFPAAGVRLSGRCRLGFGEAQERGRGIGANAEQTFLLDPGMIKATRRTPGCAIRCHRPSAGGSTCCLRSSFAVIFRGKPSLCRDRGSSCRQPLITLHQRG